MRPKFYFLSLFLSFISFSLFAQNVGIGIATPANRLRVDGTHAGEALGYFNQNATTAGSHAVKGNGAFDGTTWNITGQEIGVLGVSEGGSTTDNRGVVGLSNGIGVFGQSTIDHGIWGQTASATDFGVRAFNTNTAGTGVFASGNNLPGTYLTAGSGGAFRKSSFQKKIIIKE